MERFGGGIFPKYLYMHKLSLHYNHSKWSDCIQILNYELRASRVLEWIDGCINLSCSSCLSHTLLRCLSLSLRPQLPLRDHTEGLQQRGWGNSCVWERHHQTTVGYGVHINLTRNIRLISFILTHCKLRVQYLLWYCWSLGRPHTEQEYPIWHMLTLYCCSHSAQKKEQLRLTFIFALSNLRILSGRMCLDSKFPRR